MRSPKPGEAAATVSPRALPANRHRMHPHRRVRTTLLERSSARRAAIALLCRALLLLVVSAPVCAEDFSLPGPHAAGIRQVSISRADGSAFASWLIHPATAAGADTPPDRFAAPYPAIVFGHGFLAPPALYLATATHLASWGFVVITPASALALFPDHDAYAADYSFAADWLEDIGPNLGAGWAGMVDPLALAASGHSMGGGAAVLAAAADTRFRALGLLAPAETFPTSAIERAAALQAATLSVAGSEATITPLPRHAAPMFRAITAPRQLALIVGGSHCGFVSAPLPDWVCDRARLPAQAQLDALYRSMVPFMLFQLDRRPDLEQQVWRPRLEWRSPTLTLRGSSR